jgi:hypothetical protein
MFHPFLLFKIKIITTLLLVTFCKLLESGLNIPEYLNFKSHMLFSSSSSRFVCAPTLSEHGGNASTRLGDGLSTPS